MTDNDQKTATTQEESQTSQEESAPEEKGEKPEAKTPEKPKEEKTQEPKTEEKAEGKVKEEKPKVQVTAKLEGIIKSIEGLSVLELSQLVKALQEKFGVLQAPTVAAAAPQTGSQTTAEEGLSEGQTTFNVILANSGANKISVIKALREINPQLGLKDAKDIADAPPKEILTGVNKATADEAKQKLTTAGATVELK